MPASSRLTATLDDTNGTGVVIPMNDVDTPYGVDWRMGKLEGWDSPDLDEGAESRSGQDGMWDSENFYSGRTLTIDGVLTATSYEAREAAEYRLRQAVPRDRLVPFTVNETTPKWVMARRSGRLMVRPLNETSSEFSISMLAPDPRKYGSTPVSASLAVLPASGGLAPPWTPPVLLPAISSAPSQATMVNLGTYNSPPMITLRGPGADLSIVNLSTGRQLAFTGVTLAATDYLVIDVAAGVVLLNGTGSRSPATGSTVVAEFLMEPGDNLMRLLGTLTDTAPPTCDITFYSAWD